MVESEGKINGRKLNDLGQIGVSKSDCTEGCTIDPPAESEYAVDPVGEATISPSDCRTISSG